MKRRANTTAFFLTGLVVLGVTSAPFQLAAVEPDNVQFELTPELFGREGYQPGPFVLHLNCGDGTQTAELLKRQGVVVQGLDTSRENVETARRTLAFRKEYGKRITFRWFDGRNLPFIDNCVNAILVSGVGCQVSGEEIARVLVPRGVVLAELDSHRRDILTETRHLKPETCSLPGWRKLRKPVPSDIDQWTHHMHGPDNNRVSQDTRLAPPLSHLQWTCGPRFTRHHEHMSSFQAMVSARGKVFYIIDEGLRDSVLLPPDWNLVARDAFNGIVLWRKTLDHWFNSLWPFKSGPDVVTRRLVAKDDRLFAALEIGGPVAILDANSGKSQWSYVAGGRIDSPPAIYGNSLYFGCADGWLYRLLVSTGELVWKRRIAPADLCLFDHGQPASVWPLSGSVLVQDGKVYCVAGRSAFLDGGMRLTVVDAASGEVLKENVIDHRDPNNGKDLHEYVAMQNMPVALPHLLSSDGEHLYMMSQQFDLNGKRTHIRNSAWDDDIQIGIGREHLFAPTGFLDDNWFHRTYWVYGNGFLEGCSMPDGGWFEMSRISPSGKMLCFDATSVYGYGQFPEYSKWSTPLRYSLFAVDKKPKSYQPGVPDEELRKTRPNWRKFRSLRCPKVEFNFHWKRRVPVRAKAIVKTPDILFVAGPEDIVDEVEAYKNPQDEKNQRLLQKQNELLRSQDGGKLLAVSVRGGSTQQVIDLGSQPVWDGMAAAYGTLFMGCKDGSVVALANVGTSERGR